MQPEVTKTMQKQAFGAIFSNSHLLSVEFIASTRRLYVLSIRCLANCKALLGVAPSPLKSPPSSPGSLPSSFLHWYSRIGSVSGVQRTVYYTG